MDRDVLIGLSVVLAGVFTYYHLKKFTFWSSRGIRGPLPWPIFGTNIYYLFRNKLDVDSGWVKKYGKVYGIYEGYSPTLRITDNQIIKQVYIKQFSSFTDRNNKIINGDNMRRWMLWSSGAYWSNQRALVSPMFTSSRMRPMMTKMSGCIDHFIEEVDRRIHDTKGKGNLKECKFVKDDLMAMTLDVIAQCFYSVRVNTYKDKANEFLRGAYDLAKFNLGWFLLWSVLPRPLARYFQIDLVPFWKMKYFDKLTQSIIDERRRNKQSNNDDGTAPSNKADIIESLLEAKIPDKYEQVFSGDDDKEAHYNDQMSHEELERIQESQTKSATLIRNFSDVEIRGMCTFFFIAGFEATGSTIAFCLYELAHQLEAQDKVYEELYEKFKPADMKIDNYSDLLDLRELDAFVSETMRIYSTLIENNRLVTDKEGASLKFKFKPNSKDDDDGEKTIYLPHHTVISTNFFLVHRDGDYFERPDEFQLSRFYPENRHKIKSCTYMPFGLGPRHCVGMRFALLEVKLSLTKLLLRYQVSHGPNTATYPPKFSHHPVFLQLKHTDFKLIPRQPTEE